MEYRKLDPKAVRMWRVSRLTVLVIILAALAVCLILGYQDHTGGPEGFWAVAAWTAGALAALQLINVLVYPAIEYRQWGYLITPDRIEIRKGIFFHSTRIIPISRIQHVMVSEGPLARHYRLARVTVNTAGGSMAIEGLDRETALAICESLKTVVNRKARLMPATDGE